MPFGGSMAPSPQAMPSSRAAPPAPARPEPAATSTRAQLDLTSDWLRLKAKSDDLQRQSDDARTEAANLGAKETNAKRDANRSIFLRKRLEKEKEANALLAAARTADAEAAAVKDRGTKEAADNKAESGRIEKEQSEMQTARGRRAARASDPRIDLGDEAVGAVDPAFLKGYEDEKSKMQAEVQKGEIVTNRGVAAREAEAAEWDRRHAITKEEREDYAKAREDFQRTMQDERLDAAQKSAAKKAHEARRSKRITEERLAADTAHLLYERITDKKKSRIGEGQGKWTPAQASAIYKDYEDHLREWDNLIKEQETGEAPAPAPVGSTPDPKAAAKAAAAKEFADSADKTPEAWARIKAKHKVE